MKKINDIFYKMIEYFDGDIKRINHFTKVFGFAKAIAEGENVDENTLKIIEATALVHDIGIKLSEQKYNSSSGIYQEKEGPAEAKTLLSSLGYDDEFIERVCFIVGHHHTYTNIVGIDYQIIVEADFIVNIFEDNIEEKSILSIKEKIFKTKTGIYLLEKMYLNN